MDNYFTVLHIDIAATTYQRVLRSISDHIVKRKQLYIACVNVYSVMMLRKNARFLTSMRSGWLVVPDGMPIVWAGRLYKKPSTRVYGTELVRRLFIQNDTARIYIIGGPDGQSRRLRKNLELRYPNLRIAGIYEISSRPVSPSETAAMVQKIRETKADIVLVGLGCPHQEQWMIDNQSKIEAPVVIGVGSTLDFLSGDIPEAPAWMQHVGLEWIFRLFQEPSRLWYRYTVYNVEFLFLFLLQLLYDFLI